MYTYIKRKKKGGRTDPGQKLTWANGPRAKVNLGENKLGRTEFRTNGI